jgi:alpha-galactosidase
MPILSSPTTWVLETHHTAYALGLNAEGMLTHLYWGARLKDIADYPAAPDSVGWASFNGPGQIIPEEYPTPTGLKYIDPCLLTTFSDGTRDTVLVFDRADQHGPEELVIHLRDESYPFHVSLHYRAHPAADLIERWVTVENLGSQPIALGRIFSAQWHLPSSANYRMTHLSGRWLDEDHLQRQMLKPGLTVLESRRLTTSHNASPWFAIDRGSADEDQGEIWFGLLAWSGNWKISAEVTNFDSTRVNIGLNDWDFNWQLSPGESFTSPAALGGYTKHGFNAASHLLHDYIRSQVIPHGSATHKVLYNSWEATLFNVDVESQAKLADLAAEMGIELFVVDDGWFGTRKSDNAGLGDWWPDPDKFPNGLQPLIAHVNALGMDFGLWVEPEMVNPDSDLYRAHPDWVLHFPTRKRTESRNQLILNLARADVQEYLIETLDKLLSENNIAFIKWDMNRNASEPGWPTAEGDPREVWVRYVYGLYHVWGTLRQRHPDVIWQSCSGGGGRADLGILRLADQIWTSDNTEATARLSIQDGFSHIFPASVMEAWVTDAEAERISLDFRFHVSMCGSLGVGGHLVHWSENERQRAAHWIDLYKQIRAVIQHGRQYRLRSPQASAFSAVQYMSKDQTEGVLFAFRTHIPNPFTLPHIYLRGLDPSARYTIEGQDGAKSGLAWMEAGIQIKLANFESTALRIHKA